MNKPKNQNDLDAEKYRLLQAEVLIRMAQGKPPRQGDVRLGDGTIEVKIYSSREEMERDDHRS